MREVMSDTRSDLLNDKEWAVYDKLTEIWADFNDLPELFTQDKWEFSLGINRLKNYILARPVMREIAKTGMPGYIDTEGKDAET
jgi:hypothetical protein